MPTTEIHGFVVCLQFIKLHIGPLRWTICCHCLSYPSRKEFERLLRLAVGRPSNCYLQGFFSTERKKKVSATFHPSRYRVMNIRFGWRPLQTLKLVLCKLRRWRTFICSCHCVKILKIAGLPQQLQICSCSQVKSQVPREGVFLSSTALVSLPPINIIHVFESKYATI